MKLILTQPEIEKILRDHITLNVTLATGNDYEIDFAATRGGDGVTATIEIPYLGVTNIPVIAKTVVLDDQAKITGATTANVANADNPNPVVMTDKTPAQSPILAAAAARSRRPAPEAAAMAAAAADPVAETTTPVVDQTDAAEAVTEAVVEAAPRKSLFGNG